MRNWPIVVSRPIVGSPSGTATTSVEVPPMSKVRMFVVAGPAGDVQRAGDAARRPESTP